MTLTRGFKQRYLALSLALVGGVTANLAHAEMAHSNKLLLTGGVSQVEGAAGGGLTPWAVIGGYGTNDEIGANLHYTYAKTGDYKLDSYGLTVGFYDRFELSIAEQKFDVSNLRNQVAAGTNDAVGRDNLDQTIIGAKVRVFGEAVLDADTWMPQVAVGVQYKRNHDEKFIKGLVVGAKSAEGVDFYVAATKLFLDQSVLVNGTLRMTKANQFGLLGFGGARDNSYKPQLELSAAYLINKKLVVGAEYRMKPNNLRSPINDATGLNIVDLKEEDAFDVFVAYAPTKNVAVTLAYVNLGNIASVDILGANYGTQEGVYLSTQFGF